MPQHTTVAAPYQVPFSFLTYFVRYGRHTLVTRCLTAVIKNRASWAPIHIPADITPRTVHATAVEDRTKRCGITAMSFLFPMLSAAERNPDSGEGWGCCGQRHADARNFQFFAHTQAGAPIHIHPFSSQVESSSSTGRGLSYLHITKGVRVRFSDREQT